MVRRVGFVLLWVLATMVATGVGLAAVRGVAGEVVDAPASDLLALSTTTSEGSADPFAAPEPTAAELPPIVLGDAESFAATSTTEVPLVSPPDTTLAPEPPPAVDDPPATTAPPVVTSDPAENGSRSTPTTSPPPPPPPPPTTTTTPEAGETTYQLIGGWVRLTHFDGVVRLDAAGPASGYTMVISANGPDRVNIAFRSSDHLSKLRAEWRNADLEVEVVEESRGR